jgi:tetratricopeptide (TPR) repeat protein
MLMDGGDTRSAGACLRRLVQITPRNVAAHLNLAVVHFARGHYDEGIACCHEALRCDAEDATAMYNLALAYERLGNYAKAGEWIGRAIRIDPQDVALQRLDLRIRLLRLWQKAGRVLRSMWRWPWRH